MELTISGLPLRHRNQKLKHTHPALVRNEGGIVAGPKNTCIAVTHMPFDKYVSQNSKSLGHVIHAVISVADMGDHTWAELRPWQRLRRVIRQFADDWKMLNNLMATSVR